MEDGRMRAWWWALLAMTVAACADGALNAPDALPVALAPVFVTTGTMAFGVGDRVQTTGTANIRSGPSGSSTLVGTQPPGALGTITGGPVIDSTGDGLLRWEVDFDSGADGWAAEPYSGLQLVTAASMTSSAATVVEVTPATVGVNATGSVQLSAVAKDASGAPVPASWTWTSLKPGVAAVSPSGLVSGIKVGNASIVASTGTLSDTSVVTVISASEPLFALGDRVKTGDPAYVRSGPSGTSTYLGTQKSGAQGTVIGGPAVAIPGDGLLRWQVDFDSGVDGWVAEPNTGLTKIGSTAPPSVAGVAVTPDTATVAVAATKQLAATATDSAGNPVTGVTMTWTSRDTLKARVSTSGLVTGLAAGTVYVLATTAGKADSARISVVSAAPAVASVAVSPATASLAQGSTVQLTATPKDANGATVTASVSWSTSNAAAATVSGSGLVTGVAAGTATITATSGGKTGSAAITVTVTSVHKGWYAAPNGTSGGSGTKTSPWNLATALSGAGGKVQPGDTIWLRGGTYTGKQVSTVAGVSGKPVVVRQYPGERATLDANGITGDHFVVKGAWSVFMDFEVTNTNPTRYFSSTGNGLRSNSVVNNASNTKYLNLLVHDGGVAFFTYPQHTNVEIYGCLFYNNGWMAPDRGHGHAMYLISDNGPVVAKHNVIFNQFGYGVHAYVNAGSGSLNNIRIEGNVSFNNGTLSTTGSSPNILYGGGGTATGAQVLGNTTYFSQGVSGTNVRVGYSTTQNGSATVKDNYAVGGSVVFDMGYWTSATVSSNTFVGTSNVVQLNDPAVSGKSFAANVHRRDPTTSSWKYKGSSYTWSAWKSATGLGGTDQASTGTPTTTVATVRANPHVPGRAIIVVYNWGRQGSTSVSLGGVLSSGDQYVIRNAQNPFGPPVASGSYGGSVSVPLNPVTPVAPIGWTQKLAPSTGTDFAVFIVEKL